jgi:hypothetical protein
MIDGIHAKNGSIPGSLDNNYDEWQNESQITKDISNVPSAPFFSKRNKQPTSRDPIKIAKNTWIENPTEKQTNRE